MILEREVIVVSNDSHVRSEVSAIVAQSPGARAVFAEPGGSLWGGTTRGRCIVVIDDEEQQDALDLIVRVKGERENASVVYLAAAHSPDLEGAVRRAGASFYAVKPLRERDLTRVLEGLLG